MNGIVEISIKGEKHTLQFGVQACMLFQDLAIKNTIDPLSPVNHVKMLGDLFYCGLVGYKLRMQQPVLDYPEAIDLFNKFAEEDDFEQGTAKIWNTYSESKWGSALVNYGQTVKKKLEEESLP